MVACKAWSSSNREQNAPRITGHARKAKTVLIEPGIGFVGHGYCIYQHRLDNETVLEIRTESKTKDDIFYIHLLKNNQSLPLYGNAMKTLANNLPTLKKLTQSSDGR